MTLPEFMVESRRALDSFEQQWLQKNKEEPEHFPLTLEPGDWFEQFLTFQTNESDEL